MNSIFIKNKKLLLMSCSVAALLSYNMKRAVFDNDDIDLDDIETVHAPPEENASADFYEAMDAHIPDSIKQKGEAALIEYDRLHRDDIVSNKQDMAMLNKPSDDNTMAIAFDTVYDAAKDNSETMGLTSRHSSFKNLAQWRSGIYKHFPENKKFNKKLNDDSYTNNITIRTQLIPGDEQISNNCLKKAIFIEREMEKAEIIRKEKGNEAGFLAFFDGWKIILTKEEGREATAYPDGNGNMTGGIGFNYDKPGGEADFNRIFKNKLNFSDYRNGRKSLTEKQIDHMFDETAGINGSYTKSLMKAIKKSGADIENMRYKDLAGLMLMHFHADGLIPTNPKDMGKAFGAMCDTSLSDKQRDQSGIKGPARLYQKYIYNKNNKKKKRNTVTTVILHSRAQLVAHLLGQKTITKDLLLDDIQHRMRSHGESRKVVNIELIGEEVISPTNLATEIQQSIDLEGKDLNIYTAYGEHIHADEHGVTVSTPESRANKTVRLVSGVSKPG